MSLLTSKLANKEKRIEEYKEQVCLLNASNDRLKDLITLGQENLTNAQERNKQLRQMLNFVLQQEQFGNDE